MDASYSDDERCEKEEEVRYEKTKVLKKKCAPRSSGKTLLKSSVNTGSGLIGNTDNILSLLSGYK